MGIRQWIKDNELDKPIWERENYGLKPKSNKTKPLKTTHRIGLPVADGAKCIIDMRDTSFSFLCGNDEWILEKRKISNIERMKESQVHVHMKGRPGMALLGGATFGILGAVVGSSMSKKKKTKTHDRFLIFDYKNDDGELKSIVVQYDGEGMGTYYQHPKMYVSDFQKHPELYGEGETHVL